MEKIIKKIKKCLALAKSSNANEAALALAYAQRLMQNHGISAADIELSSINKKKRPMSNTKTPPRYLYMLAGLICDVFGCQIVLESVRHWDIYRTSAAFIGPGENPTIAAYAFDVLRRQLVRDRKRYLSSLKRLKRSTKTKRADLWAQAWCRAVESKVIKLALTPKEDALIQTWKDRHYQELEVSLPAKPKKLGRGDGTAIAAGYVAGTKVNLHPGVVTPDGVSLIP